MRNRSLIVASIAALLTFGAGPSANAQQPVPDAPQPQKKPAPKPQSTQSPSPDTGKPVSPPPSTKDENPFPEEVSKQAAKAAAGSTDSDAGSPRKSTATDNPFPESVSRDAAKAAGNDASRSPLRSGISLQA